MGIVVRQSIITTIISYAGIVIGYVNLIFLYPQYLELNQVGLLRAIQDGAMLLTPFASFGLAQCIARFYPKFSKDKEILRQFLGLLVVLALIGFCILLLTFFLFKPGIVSFFADKSPEVTHYTGLVLWLTFTLLYTGLFEQYARSQLKIIVPALLREVGTRLLQSILVLLYFSGVVSFSDFIFLSVLVYVLMLSILMIYLRLFSLTAISLSFSSITRDQLKEIALFSVVSFVGLSSVVLIAKIDSIMVVGMVGLDAAAIYTTAYYMATVIEVPKRAITQSATTLMAHAFERNDMAEVKKIYSKSSINQMIIGALILVGIWANIQNIFAIMPKGNLYGAGIWVVLIIGSAKLIDMTFGPSSEVIGLSKYYWFNLVVISVLAIFIVVANALLIPIYGMNGAAIGTLIALSLYNIFKFGFILFRLKLNPFSWNTGKVVIVGSCCYFIQTLIPALTNPYLDVLVRSGIITILFSTLILAWHCSEDANQLFLRGLSRFGWRTKS
jgi:O-antigen/teichoic acid export membrane protein